MTDDANRDLAGMSRPPGPINLNRYEIEPAWLGFQTFNKLPVCLTPEDLRAGEIDVAICGVPWDGTAISRSGTHLGHAPYGRATTYRRRRLLDLTSTSGSTRWNT